jgi:OOP family OmpA-OmpF porin
VFGLRLGYDLTKNWGVEAVGSYLETEGTRSGRSVNALSYGVDILYNFMPEGPLVPYLAVGGGGLTYGHGKDGLKINSHTNTDATYNAGLGIKYYVTDSIALRGDARQLFILEQPDPPHYNWIYTAGLTFLFGGEKAAPVAVQPPPAPPAPTSSLNVVPGSISKGETAKLSWSSQNTTNCDINPNIGSVKPQGSMTISPAADTSYTLSCTGQGGSTSSNASLTVIQPAPIVLDSDGDGVPDDLDKCPNTPAGVKVDKDGCPIDSDKDGVADYLDKCPDTPSGVKVDANGCPFPTDKACESFKLVDITFDFNKTDIKPEFIDELQKVGDFLKKNSTSTAVMDGHTDYVGTAAYNMKLSERRADSVRSYIVNTFGIAVERISTKGYGLTKPIASNKTAEGRAKNRRTETSLICGK